MIKDISHESNVDDMLKLKMGTTLKSIVLSLFAYLWVILYANRKIANISFKNILLVFPYGIGNTVLANGAVRSIKKCHPDSELTAIYMQQPTREMLEILGGFKELIYYDASSSKKEDGRYIKELSDKKFDVSINLFAQGSCRFNRILMYAKVPTRVGFQLPKMYGGFESVLYLTHFTKYDPCISEFKNDLYLLNMLNIPQDNKISFSLSKYKQVRNDSKIRIGIHVGRHNTRRPGWSVEKFSELILLLKSRYNAEIFVFGGQEESKISAYFDSNIKGSIVNMVGKNSLEETIDYIHSMDLFISNDTGLMHLAASQNIPLIAIFGPTDMIKSSPIIGVNGKLEFISKNMSCQPCYPNSFAIKCEGRLDCVNNISVEEVFRVVSNVVKGLNIAKSGNV